MQQTNRTQPNVTVIPASRDVITGIPKTERRKKKVAAYARVSTDSEEQLTSYEAQVDYYTNYIKSKAEWEYVDTYADEGISGVMTKHRSAFNKMVSDALAGKIDLIITKSVSRFARNTVDSLTTIRKLKEKGVEVYFEKENIYSLDSKGELLLTLMSSLAQEESRSLSQNVTWGRRKKFADGKITLPYKQFLGYRKGADGNPEIDPGQAVTVRRIYRDFINGKSCHTIAQELTADGILTPSGKSKWQKRTVESILTNEKYKGDALLQKTFTVDYLTKTMKVNEGEVPQYYVTGSHPAIIDPPEWDQVQVEMQKRKNGEKVLCSGIFSGKIFCADCGSIYGSKVWHSNDKYRCVIWQCNSKFKDKKCGTPHLREENIKTAFVKAFAEYFEQRDAIISDFNIIIEGLKNTTEADTKIARALAELDIVTHALEDCVNRNARAEISEEEYRQKYDSLYAKYNRLSSRVNALESEKADNAGTAAALQYTINILQNCLETPFSFSLPLWNACVEKVVVHDDCRLDFHMFGNVIVTEEI